MTTYRIAVLGLLNTREVNYIKEELENEGFETEGMSSQDSLEEIKAKAENLLSASKLHGIIAFGEPRETKIAVQVMKLLPIGFPKLLVTRIHGKKDMSSIFDEIGAYDITVLPISRSASILGSLKRIILNAVGAIIEMSMIEMTESSDGKPLIGVTTVGVTAPCAADLISFFEARGYGVMTFHGRTEILSKLIGEGKVRFIIDLAPCEIMWRFSVPNYSDEKVRNRLQIAGEKGVAQVIVPGGLDMLIFGGTRSKIPRYYRKRPTRIHSVNTVLVRTVKRELEYAGEVLAERANRARGPTAIVTPLRGFSENDKEGNLFFDPEADAGFINAVEKKAGEHVRIVKVDAHVNDRVFAEEIVKTFEDLNSSTW